MKETFLGKTTAVWNGSISWIADQAMCLAMNRVQWQIRHQTHRKPHELKALENYLKHCASLSREEFFASPSMEIPRFEPPFLLWKSPVLDCYVENNRACVEWYPLAPSSPTVIILHALMSAHPRGYRKLVPWFHARGWSVAIAHLPYHFSRNPAGYWNGSLAITSDLIRNAERLKQGVIEIRQFMEWLRHTQGCSRFGLLGTSYGGWIASLVSFLEPALAFVALIQPIANIEHALWENPSTRSLRHILTRNGIPPGITRQHAHLTSPRDSIPLCAASRILLAAGRYDTISPPSELHHLAERWGAPPPIIAPHGHFGYAALAMVKSRLPELL